MKIFHSLYDFKPTKKTIVTIGTFDGVHIGHKKIIEKLTTSQSVDDFESLILTFYPHPRMVLKSSPEIKLLNTIEEKAHLLENAGLNNLIIHPFDKAFSELSGEDFVKKILVDQFNVKKIIIGHDHRFGKNRSADIKDLIFYSKKYDFDVEQISAEEINEVSVSSTKIRNAILEGNINLAKDYLGYSYFFKGIVIYGKQLGRTLGFPTANIKMTEDYKLIPQNGVYVVQSFYQGKRLGGMMNIGTNPTLNGTNQAIEIHFFDFNSDLYGQEIEISILHRLRSEQKFESLDQLKQQLENDKISSLAFLQKIP
ncbi:MAG: bifunctional riboflavin kinase/FAD synthetase [Bacteroidota bacterium]